MSNFTTFKNFPKLKSLASSILSVSFLSLYTTASFAGNPTGTITNEDFSIDEAVGNTITLDRIVTVNLDNLVNTITETVTGAPEKVDILFLADNTGSMGDEIANVQVNAQDILNDLRAAYTDTTDIQFGVARYYGAPREYGYYWESCGWYCGSWNTSNASVPGDKKITGTQQVPETHTTTYTFKKQIINGNGRIRYVYSYITVDPDGNETDSGNVRKRNWKGSSYTETETHYSTENVYGEPVEMDAYELQVAIGGTDTEILSAIGTTSTSDDSTSWHADGGKDTPEANFFALHQAATSGEATDLGWQTEYDTNWRDDAMKVIVWFGDAPSQTADTTELEAINALNDNDITVIAVNVGWLNHNNQASNIATATSGQYSYSNSDNVASTIENLIGTAVDGYTTTIETTITPIIDIDFRNSADTPIPNGITVTYNCTDPQGCNEVNNGDSRSFQMIVEGNNAGNYVFETEVFDVETSNEVVDADNTVNYHNID